MIRILVYGVIAISIFFILSEIIKYLGAVNGTNRQIQKDKVEFMTRLLDHELVSWPWSELSALSQNFELNYSTKVFNSIYEGIYTSIFQEDLGNVIAKQYGEKYLILIRTQDDICELIFEETGKSSLLINDVSSYSFNLSASELRVENPNISVKLLVEKGYSTIKVGDKDMFKVNPLEAKNKSLERLVALNPEPLNQETEKIVKFLLLFYLIWQELMD